MTLTAKGFAGGPMTDADFGAIAAASAWVESTDAFRVTQPNTGTRSVAITAGASIAYGVRVINDAAATQALSAPGSGLQWYMIALRRDWGAKTSSIVALSGPATTATTAPAAIPTTLPATLQNNPGLGQHDQPLAWVAVLASTATVAIFDLRMRMQLDMPCATTPSALAVFALQNAPLLGLSIPCISDGVTYRWDGTNWSPLAVAASQGWAPGYGGDGGATTGNDGGTSGSVARIGNHIFYSGRVLFGSSAVAGGAVLTGFNLFGNNNNLTIGSGFYRIQGGSVWPFVLRPVTPSEFQILVTTNNGAVGLSQITANPPQSSELVFDAHAVIS